MHCLTASLHSGRCLTSAALPVRCHVSCSLNCLPGCVLLLSSNMVSVCLLASTFNMPCALPSPVFLVVEPPLFAVFLLYGCTMFTSLSNQHSLCAVVLHVFLRVLPRLPAVLLLYCTAAVLLPHQCGSDGDLHQRGGSGPGILMECSHAAALPGPAAAAGLLHSAEVQAAQKQDLDSR